LPFFGALAIMQPLSCTMTSDGDPIDSLLRALADATRRSLLDRLRDAPGLTLGELSAGVALTRQALSKHLAVLESAELVVPVWRGREKLHYLNPVPLQALPQRWVTPGQHGSALAALQRALQPAAQAVAAPKAVGSIAALLLVAPGVAGTAISSAAELQAARSWLAGTADAVRRIAESLSPTAGYVQPADGGFSIAAHLWHLADVEELGWAVRFERLLAERRPRLAGVDGDRLAVERRYQQRPWRGAARRFIAQRRRTLRALGRFDAAALALPATFAGRATRAGDVLAAMVAHDLEHRGEMAALMEKETT
jgi:DNA-binding transcriptional ArsR family regulator/uncharacterized damage-inducible protein DinB